MPGRRFAGSRVRRSRTTPRSREIGGQGLHPIFFGRTPEWKQFAEASELKDSLVRMVADFGVSARRI